MSGLCPKCSAATLYYCAYDAPDCPWQDVDDDDTVTVANPPFVTVRVEPGVTGSSVHIMQRRADGEDDVVVVEKANVPALIAALQELCA